MPSVRLEALNTGNQIWSASFCTVAIDDDFLWRSLQKYDLLLPISTNCLCLPEVDKSKRS